MSFRAILQSWRAKFSFSERLGSICGLHSNFCEDPGNDRSGLFNGPGRSREEVSTPSKIRYDSKEACGSDSDALPFASEVFLALALELKVGSLFTLCES